MPTAAAADVTELRVGPAERAAFGTWCQRPVRSSTRVRSADNSDRQPPWLTTFFVLGSWAAAAEPQALGSDNG